MVGRWGMSAAVGPVAVIPREDAGPFLPGAAEVSPGTRQLVDDEVRRIVEESHRAVVALLQQNRVKLDALASALLEHETLDEEDAYATAGVPRVAAPDLDSYVAADATEVVAVPISRQVRLALFGTVTDRLKLDSMRIEPVSRKTVRPVLGELGGFVQDDGVACLSPLVCLSNDRAARD